MQFTSLKSTFLVCFLTLLALPVFAQRAGRTAVETAKENASHTTPSAETARRGPIRSSRSDDARARQSVNKVTGTRIVLDNRDRQIRKAPTRVNRRPASTPPTSRRAEKDTATRPVRADKTHPSAELNRRPVKPVRGY